jgi:hypothetical protein
MKNDAKLDLIAAEFQKLRNDMRRSRQRAMGLTRRGFVGLIATLPIALKFTPEIGVQAGGYTLPFPSNFREYMEVYPVSYPTNQLEGMLRATAMLAWAQPGETVAQIQMYGGSAIVSPQHPALTEVKLQNIERSLRGLWREEHTPGWLKVLVSGPDDVSARHEWKRVGYMRWLKPHELKGATFAVPEAA